MADATAAPSAEGEKNVTQDGTPTTPSNKIESAIVPGRDDDSINVQVAREMFLTHVFRDRNELISAARKVDLSIYRSQKERRRVSFYPKAMDKVGNTVCTFSAPKRVGHLWSRTGKLDDILEKWNAITKSQGSKKPNTPSRVPSIPMLLEVGRAAAKREAEKNFFMNHLNTV